MKTTLPFTHSRLVSFLAGCLLALVTSLAAGEQAPAQPAPEAAPQEGTAPPASEAPAAEAAAEAGGDAAAAETVAEEPGKPEEKLPPRLPLNELRVFAEAFNRISSAYVEEIDDRALLDKAIRGLLAELDPHSAYLSKKSFANLQETTSGNYGGLGLEVTTEDGLVKVVSPMDDTPAAKAGLNTGDLIIELDDMPVQDMTLSESIEVMRGEPGTELRMKVIKSGTSKPVDVTLTRDVIKVASIRHRMLEEGYAYLRIAVFQIGTGGELQEALSELTADGQLNGLVLDLRNNPGGVLQAAVEVADVFMEPGLVVYTKGRLGDANVHYHAKKPDFTAGVPMVVLVNGGSASASEIVAGALQDRGRAVIMGTTTFGKGSVQTVLPLNNEKAIKLTTSKYYTPKGNSIQATGIVPDIVVEASKVTPIEGIRHRKEQDLPGHLSASEEEKPEAEQQNGMALAQEDYQLNEALTLLKGLRILLGAKVKTPPS